MSAPKIPGPHSAEAADLVAWLKGDTAYWTLRRKTPWTVETHLGTVSSVVGAGLHVGCASLESMCGPRGVRPVPVKATGRRLHHRRDILAWLSSQAAHRWVLLNYENKIGVTYAINRIAEGLAIGVWRGEWTTAMRLMPVNFWNGGGRCYP